MGVCGGLVRGAGAGPGRAWVRREPRGVGEMGVVAEGVAVTRPTLLGLGAGAPPSVFRRGTDPHREQALAARGMKGP